MYGRPRFAKRSFRDEQTEEIAAMYPDSLRWIYLPTVPDGMR